MRFWGLLGLLGVVGCSSGTPPEWKSGDRLRARVIDGGEGATIFEGWFDASLGAPCAFIRHRDGVMRCVPLPNGGVISYADAGCTDRLVQLSPCESPKSVTMVAWDACERESASVHQLGGPFANDTPTAVYAPDGQGNCVQQGQVQGVPLFHLGAEQPGTDFVSATAKDDPLDGVIGLRRLVAEDGAEESRGLFDVARGTDCTTFGDGSRCIPAIHVAEGPAPAGTTFYRDSYCTKAVHVALSSSLPASCSADPEELGIQQGAHEMCDFFAPDEIHRIKEVSLTSYYAEDPAHPCYKVTQDSQAYELGDAVPLDSFPALPIVDRGTGRLRARAYADSAGAPMLGHGGFLDTEAQRAACLPLEFKGGTRCSPTLSFEGGFADASCSEPIIASPILFGCPPTLPTFVLGKVGDDACDLTYRAYQRGAEIQPAMVYSSSAGMCVASPADSQMVYAPLTPFDESAWAPVKVVTE